MHASWFYLRIFLRMFTGKGFKISKKIEAQYSFTNFYKNGMYSFF